MQGAGGAWDGRCCHVLCSFFFFKIALAIQLVSNTLKHNF